MNFKDMKIHEDLRKSGVTHKQYVIGRRDADTETGTLNVGRYLALDRSLGSNVHLDALRPHAVLICGKRGYGKSYTMGTIIEELALLPDNVNISILIIDTMGIFWTMKHPNDKEHDILSKWDLSPAGIDIELFIPEGHVELYDEMNVKTNAFSISVSEISGSDWCSLFNMSTFSETGVLIQKTVEEIREKSSDYSIANIIETINNDNDMDPAIRMAVKNYFFSAMSWGIFSTNGSNISEMIQKKKVSILDLSSIGSQSIRSIIVKVLGYKIYNESVRSRRIYEQCKIDKEQVRGCIPMVWLFIDEAHLFLPVNDETPASSILVNEWLRQGRQPGLSIILATQRPGALHPDVISQSDIIICHRITAQDDITALEAVRPTYMRDGIADSLKKLGTEKGAALIVDDNSESAHIVMMRPRKSWHGGDEPSAIL